MISKLALLLLVLPSTALAGPVQHVIHISVDGLRADVLDSLIATDPAGYANFKRFVDEGATTFNARTDYTHSITLPNHTCMLTGRPVLQPAAQAVTVHHGYVTNGDPLPTETLHNSGNLAVLYKASTFDVVHDHGLSTAHFASKSKFALFDQSFDAVNGAPDVTGPDNGRDKIDTYVQMSTGIPASAANMDSAYRSAMSAQHFSYSFLHYIDPDAAGHATGWGSATYNAAVHTVDGFLGSLFQLVTGDAELNGHTVIILSTDHGGTDTNHQDATVLTNCRIPFFVWGEGVAHGDLYALNPGTRLDPGTGLPDYDAPLQPIRNGDGGNLALDLLGLPPIPGSTIDASQNLRVDAAAASVPATSPWLALALGVALGLGGAAVLGRVRSIETPS